MTVSFDADLPGSPEAVMRCYADAGFYDALATELELIAHEVDIDTSDGLKVAWVRHVPTDEIPSFLRRFVGQSVGIIEKRTWTVDGDGSFRSPLDVTADIKGRRATITGTIVLSPKGTGSHLSVRGVVEASVPLVGKTVRGAIAELAVACLEDEVTLLQRWLERPAQGVAAA